MLRGYANGSGQTVRWVPRVVTEATSGRRTKLNERSCRIEPKHHLLTHFPHGCTQGYVPAATVRTRKHVLDDAVTRIGPFEERINLAHHSRRITDQILVTTEGEAGFISAAAGEPKAVAGPPDECRGIVGAQVQCTCTGCADPLDVL